MRAIRVGDAVQVDQRIRAMHLGLPARNPEDFTNAVEQMNKKGAEAIFVTPDAMFTSSRARTAETHSVKWSAANSG